VLKRARDYWVPMHSCQLQTTGQCSCSGAECQQDIEQVSPSPKRRCFPATEFARFNSHDIRYRDIDLLARDGIGGDSRNTELMTLPISRRNLYTISCMDDPAAMRL